MDCGVAGGRIRSTDTLACADGVEPGTATWEFEDSYGNDKRVTLRDAVESCSANHPDNCVGIAWHRPVPTSAWTDMVNVNVCMTPPE